MTTLRQIQFRILIAESKIFSEISSSIRRLNNLSYAKVKDEYNRYKRYKDNTLAYYLILVINAKLTKMSIWVLKQDAKNSTRMRNFIDRRVEVE